MEKNSQEPVTRILLIDDNPDIHEDYKRILAQETNTNQLDELEAELFGVSSPQSNDNLIGLSLPEFEISSALQGAEGVVMAKKALADKQPYAMAFVDMRMPPGWDGLKTIKHLWEEDSNIQVVICTAHSDYSRNDIIMQVGMSDKFLILKKPFDTVEVAQLANALTRKWALTREAAIKRDDLNRMVDMRTRELAQARDQMRQLALEADAANRMKSEFLANMSHEIRTPMNGVIGMTSLLIDTELSAEQMEYAEIVQRSGHHLLSVINDILDFSKIEAGKLNIEKISFNLRSSLAEVVDIIQFKAREKDLVLACLIHPDVPNHICGDPGRLRQILLYLLNNAIKYTKDGNVTIHVNIVSQTSNNVTLRFEISDTGIGIPEKRVNSLFEVFPQTGACPVNDAGSTGLGLSISKRLVTMMEGKIGVTSKVGEGSTFWFTANLNKDPNFTDTMVPLLSDISNQHILIVDPSSAARRIIRLQLESWGAIVDEAASDSLGMEKLRTASQSGHPYHIAIIYMFLPEVDGLMMGRQIKFDSDVYTTDLILVALGYTQKEEKCAMELGFSAYLNKPVKHERLRNCLERVIGRSKNESKEPLPMITEVSLTESSSLTNLNILLVEDRLLEQKATAAVVTGAGYRIECVSNGREACEILSRVPYDVILMDCVMPEMNGIDAVKEIRAIEQARKERSRSDFEASETPVSAGNSHDSQQDPVAIIALTGAQDKYNRENCLAAGMNDYLVKPVDVKKLLAIIKKWGKSKVSSNYITESASSIDNESGTA